jgi:signal transduction histidine kinase/CheY-like chemotaxis protein
VLRPPPLRLLRRQPIGRKLPLLISGLLVTVLAALGWTAYQRMKHSVLAVASDRLTSAADQFGALISTSSRQGTTSLARLAARPELRAALTAATPASAAAALEAIALPAPPAGRPQTFVRALWSHDCRRLVVATGEPTPSMVARCQVMAARGARTMAVDVSPFTVEGGEARFAVSAPVHGADGGVAGILVEGRSFAQAQGVDRIAGLIGREVAVRVGNRDGTAWSDLVRPLEGPPPGIPTDQLTSYGDAAGRVELGVARVVPGTPWLAWVQMPEAAALAPARGLLGEILVAAFACVLAGALGAWLVGRHVAAPIHELTAAADELARGNYTQRVREARGDELGVLAHAFNTMASRVEEANAELHARYHEASEMAAELEATNQELLESMAEARVARRESHEARSLFDDVLATAPEGLALYDRKLRYRQANGAFAAMAELGAANPAGRAPDPHSHRLDAALLPLLEQVMRDGAPLLNHRVVAREGTRDRACCTVSIFPVRSPDRDITGVACVAVDTSAQDELELQLLQAQKMDAVGRLAGGIAHDFNNLLTVITSYAGLALENLPAEAPLREDMREIRAAADRATALTRQLLAFSRKQVMQPRVVHLNDLAHDMERMLQRLIGEDVELALDLAPDLGDVHADPGQLQQVLLNLAVNARDAMPHGGRLRVETRNTTLSRELSIGALGASAGEYVTLTVTDTGTGMTPEIQAHLFEPFFTTKPTGQGTGLGLATVYGVVKQSGGDIHVQSAPGEGTQVRIYLPRYRDESPAVVAPPTALSPNRGTETVLLVEDDPALRALAARILTRAGYRVLEAGSPEEALAHSDAHEGTVHLLLTDVVMPGLNGREVAERIHVSRPATRVLYMSGYTDDEIMRRGIVAAETRFLQKPFSPEGLVRAVRDALDDARPVAHLA